MPAVEWHLLISYDLCLNRTPQASQGYRHGAKQAMVSHGLLLHLFCITPYSFSLSSTIVKGPSFTSCTCMYAPKDPVSQCQPASRQRETM